MKDAGKWRPTHEEDRAGKRERVRATSGENKKFELFKKKKKKGTVLVGGRLGKALSLGIKKPKKIPMFGGGPHRGKKKA